ncbi:MAG TPA: hypothetical protein VNQ80_02610 [Parapedobacter sp.]|uniref:hypothetical protein n=1 Tax=Parapedobacter sp. TaxID=1958893 RepID=UPI002C03D830|nr:hypothetical protein [Parapedobacter sp.]HWK56200.1 hypothetical protein [Parapedobacter sp.]
MTQYFHDEGIITYSEAFAEDGIIIGLDFRNECRCNSVGLINHSLFERQIINNTHQTFHKRYPNRHTVKPVLFFHRVLR